VKEENGSLEFVWHRRLAGVDDVGDEFLEVLPNRGVADFMFGHGD